jgi:hypothetical protein
MQRVGRHIEQNSSREKLWRVRRDDVFFVFEKKCAFNTWIKLEKEKIHETLCVNFFSFLVNVRTRRVATPAFVSFCLFSFIAGMMEVKQINKCKPFFFDFCTFFI